MGEPVYAGCVYKDRVYFLFFKILLLWGHTKNLLSPLIHELGDAEIRTEESQDQTAKQSRRASVN